MNEKNLMFKRRYWNKQLYIADLIYQSTANDYKVSGVFTRSFNLCCEINDYLFNLEDD